MAEETTSNKTGEQVAAETSETSGAEKAAPTAKAPKKEKAPALEDKPFVDFVQQDFLPALKDGLAKQGLQDVDLSFDHKKISVPGLKDTPECWQVVGIWSSGWKQPRQFNIYFLKDDIQGPKAFSYAESSGRPSTLESFLIDERKVNLGLLVFGVLQRLNAQKWLVRN